MIKTFSIKDSDTEHKQMFKKIEAYCKEHGVSKSYIILQALTKYWNEVLHAKVQ